MKISSKELALSGISAALAIVFVLGAVYVPNLTLSFYVLAALSISLPLIKNYILGSIFSYIVSGVLAFLLANVQILPYIIFFGPYAIILWLLDFKLYNIEKIQKVWRIVIIVIVKVAYFFAAFFACYYLMNILLTDFALFGINWTLPLLIVVTYLLFSCYDFAYREVYKVLSRMVIKRIGKQ